MKKRFLALILSLSMCIGLCIPAMAADSDFVIEDGILTAYSGPGGTVEIPEGVTIIARGVFQDRADVTSITFPSSLTDIGPSAFQNCTGLTSITFPDNITMIEMGAFTGCTGLTTVTLPNRITEISQGVFASCTNLTSITIPQSVTTIWMGAFGSSTNLKDVYYAGTQEQWGNINIMLANEPLDSATIYYNSAPAEAPASPFTDIAADAYYADAVLWAVENGITSGTSASTFSPNATCTTAQILTFLWRANSSPAPAGSNAAVPAGKYYTDAASWALEKGLTDSFDADTPATRAATVTYLWKLAGKPAAASAAFTDVAADATYASAVAWAVKEGITAGTSASTFSPDNTCTRGQIVTFLYRDSFGESAGENSSSNNQTVTPNAGGNSYEQDISALMAEGYTREEAHEILELMAGGYSEESAKDAVRMTEEELEQQQKDFEEWVESVGGSYDPETGAFWVP